MLFSLPLLFAFVAVVNAHFQLQFPAPRGQFVEDDEIHFCDGYNSAASNRTVFPLSGGFYSLNSEHPRWTVAVLVSTAANPTSFNNFSQATPFAQLNGEGIFCLPLDFSHSNVTGLTDGQNVTVQIEFSGGDGSLFQCADLTLSSSASLSSVSCTNATGSGSSTSSSAASGATSPAPSPTNGEVGTAVNYVVLGIAGMLSLLCFLC